jgi:hypothetical protein
MLMGNMRRTTLAGALAITAALVWSGGSRSAVARCGDSQLVPHVQTQGENTTAWIGLLVRNRGASCLLHGQASINLWRGQHLALVRGNPLTINVRGQLPRARTWLVVADWSNWCGTRNSIRLTVRYRLARIHSTFSTLPVCLQARSPSRLVRVGSSLYP